MIKLIKSFVKKMVPWLDQDIKIYKIYKKSNNLFKKNQVFFAFYYRYKILKRYNCIFSPMSNIGKNLSMPHPMGIVIGGDTKIGENCTIYQYVTIGQNNNKFPKIGDNVTIYAGAKIIGDVEIGNNVIVGANAVVTHDVPNNSVVAGVPAKIIKKK